MRIIKKIAIAIFPIISFALPSWSEDVISTDQEIITTHCRIRSFEINTSNFLVLRQAVFDDCLEKFSCSITYKTPHQAYHSKIAAECPALTSTEVFDFIQDSKINHLPRIRHCFSLSSDRDTKGTRTCTATWISKEADKKITPEKSPQVSTLPQPICYIYNSYIENSYPNLRICGLPNIHIHNASRSRNCVSISDNWEVINHCHHAINIHAKMICNGRIAFEKKLIIDANQGGFFKENSLLFGPCSMTLPETQIVLIVDPLQNPGTEQAGNDASKAYIPQVACRLT